MYPVYSFLVVLTVLPKSFEFTAIPILSEWWDHALEHQDMEIQGLQWV